VTHALVALHASDPASVYLSVLARSSASTLADVSAAMYERRTLVRWMAMRRTLFLLPRADVPVMQAAISTPLAAVLRRRLLSQLKRNGTEPPVDGDLETWLSSLQGRVEHALRARGGATGSELAADVSALRTGAAGGAISAQPAPATSSITPRRAYPFSDPSAGVIALMGQYDAADGGGSDPGRLHGGAHDPVVPPRR
jgi:hypothetical protein